jgi:hypothetical protein
MPPKRKAETLKAAEQSNSKYYHYALFSAPTNSIPKELGEVCLEDLSSQDSLVGLNSSQTQSSLDSRASLNDSTSEDDENSLVRSVRPELLINTNQDPLWPIILELYGNEPLKHAAQEPTSAADNSNAEGEEENLERSVRPEKRIHPDNDPLSWENLFDLYRP